MSEDLSIHEAAADPLINQVLKADGVPQAAFAQLLQSAARVRAKELERAMSEDGSVAAKADDADLNTPNDA